MMDQEIKKRYVQLQMLEQQTGQMQQHIEQMDQQAAELAQVAENLREIKDIKEGTEILVPMAGGVFVCASLRKTDHVLVNVGASSSVHKKVDDAVALVEEQLKELIEYREKAAGQLMAEIDKARKVHDELTAFAEKE